MKHLFLIIGLAVLISCNNKLNKNEKSSQDTINKNAFYQPKYDSIISEMIEYDLATDAIPLLEAGMKDLDGANDLQNKIKIELSSTYLLDYFMDPSGNSRSSLIKAIDIFEEVLANDSISHFFSRVLDVNSSEVDSMHIMWHEASSEKEKIVLLDEFTNNLCLKMYPKEQ